MRPLPEMPRSRVFFALPPPPAVRETLGRLAVSVATRAEGRPTRADSIHLTLAFVGDVAASSVPVLDAIGARVRGAPFTLALDTEGGFRRARVGWVAPSHAPAALHALQRALAQALVAEDFRLEARPFAAYVTLARHCRSVPEARALAAPIDWPVDRFALWASSSTIGGPRYREIAGWTLRDD